jgi:hypothetical protein
MSMEISIKTDIEVYVYCWECNKQLNSAHEQRNNGTIKIVVDPCDCAVLGEGGE